LVISISFVVLGRAPLLPTRPRDEPSPEQQATKPTAAPMSNAERTDAYDDGENPD
jgi:hypothetical protein